MNKDEQKKLQRQTSSESFSLSVCLCFKCLLVCFFLLQILQSHSQLSQYLERYSSRLKGSNVVYIKQLLVLLKTLSKALQISQNGNPNVAKDEKSNSESGQSVRNVNLEPKVTETSQKGIKVLLFPYLVIFFLNSFFRLPLLLLAQRVLSINDFLFDAKMDHFNLFKILRYISNSEIVKKVN